MMIRSNGWSLRSLVLCSFVTSAVIGGCGSSTPLESADRASSGLGISPTPSTSGAPAPKPTTAFPAPGIPGASTPKVGGLAVVPGQLVVKFKSDSPAGISSDVHSCLQQGRSFASITADASSSLDGLVRRHGIFRAASLVQGREGLSTRDAKALLRARGSNLARAKIRAQSAPLEELVNVYRMDLAANADLEAAMADLRSDPHVEYVHPNYVAHLVYTPNDPYWSSSGSWGQPRADLWDLKLMHTSQAWDATRGNGVVVAVVDTGVDINHPDLAGNVWTNPGEIPDNGVDDDGNGFIDDVHGWSVLGNNNQVDDFIGHGTHVAGTIAAQDNNGIGVVGVAPDAKIMPVQVFSFSSDAFTLSQGILYAVHNGADVINNSWEICAGYCPSVGVVEDAVRTAHAAGTVVVFAAGNEGADIRDRSPQNLPETIVVSATTPGDTRADFSNFGLIDVAAPGSGDPNDSDVVEPSYGLLSLRAASCFEPWICNPDRNVGENYVRLAGTSMAAPHAAGVAALILGLHPSYSPEQVRQVMRRTSIDANGNGYDTNLGYGRVDTAKLGTEPTPLEALIQAPRLVQTAQLPIAGKANGAQFQKYVLEYGKGTAPTSWTTIITSTSPVSTGNLGTWDASKIADGDYSLRLSAYKTNGARYEDLHLLALDRVQIASPKPNVTLVAGDIPIVGIANPGTFKSFNVRVQTFDAGTPVNANLALTNGGKQPVANGVLAVWHAQNIAAGHYRITLDVTNSDGSVISRNVVLIVDPLLHGGWPVGLPVSVYQDRGPAPPSEPIALADLDGDGKAEVLAGFGDKVSVFKGDGSLVSGWPQSLATPENPSMTVKAMPIAGDLDGDGTKEVVVATWEGYIFVWGANGALKPGWPRLITYTTDWGTAPASLSLSLGDVDRNGILDLVATDAQQTGVHVFKGNGSYLPGWPASTWRAIKTPATVADLNKDGKNEVVIGVDGNPAQLVVLSAKGVVLPGWPRTLMSSSNESTGSYPVVGDLDDDGDLEIAALTCDGGGDDTLSKVVIYQHNGQLLTSWSTGAVQTGPLVLADLDGDGSLDVLESLMKMDGTGGLYAWDRKGTLLSGWPQSNPGATPLFNAPIVVDLEGDGRNEVITARQPESWSDELQIHFGYPVQAYRYDGSLVPNLARPAYGSWYGADGSPAVADIDGDGRLELVWTEIREQGPSMDFPLPRIFAWDLTTPSSNSQPWPMYRADARHSGVAEAVVPIQKLTTRNQTYRINGLARFQIQTQNGGTIQIKHPWQASVKYAIDSAPLKATTLGWGEQITVAPFRQVLLRVVTTAPIDVSIDWW
ncbi:MAG TPA: S8 family serine peptidase [Polyangiaceae bacterium]|nr:S8 family serine peptidase [Polyangiaceae bacterium]